MVQNAYKSEDGEYFDTHHEAQQHEMKEAALKALNNLFKESDEINMVKALISSPRKAAAILNKLADDMGIPQL